MRLMNVSLSIVQQSCDIITVILSCLAVIKCFIIMSDFNMNLSWNFTLVETHENFTFIYLTYFGEIPLKLIKMYGSQYVTYHTLKFMICVSYISANTNVHTMDSLYSKNYYIFVISTIGFKIRII